MSLKIPLGIISRKGLFFMGSINNRVNKKSQRYPISRGFKLIFLTVVALTLISLACCIYLSSQAELNSIQQDLYKTCSTTWKMGFGAIVYLIWKKFPKEIL